MEQKSIKLKSLSLSYFLIFIHFFYLEHTISHHLNSGTISSGSLDQADQLNLENDTYFCDLCDYYDQSELFYFGTEFYTTILILFSEIEINPFSISKLNLYFNLLRGPPFHKLT